ncbi:MAG TPA: hypothetical protein VH817_14745 [Thermoleophilaceae bacterium]|jgi:hypothetical protein
MSPDRAERLVVFTMRALALTFAVVGLLFIITPNGVLGRMDDVGNWIGSFHTAPQSDEKLWLALGFAYMTVITGIALVISTDVGRYRPFLLVLAAGKAASSLVAGAFFVFGDDVFIYLLNFLVDGSLVLIVLWCWHISAPLERRVAPT